MKSSLRKLLLGFALLLLAFNSHATHLAAADIYLDYIGDGTTLKYRLTVAIYKACEKGGAPLLTTETAGYYSPSGCGNSDPISVTLTAPKIDTLDHLCDTFKAANSCRVDTSKWPAFIRHTFVKEIELPRTCSDWTFFWTEGDRNAAIRNLVYPYAIYVDCSINNTKRLDISTPRYTVDPIPYYCRYGKSIVNNAPYDPDGDDMISANVQPRFAATSVVPYATITPAPPASPYTFSLVDPIETTPDNPYRVDPATCAATFTATIADTKYVFAYRTYKYDKITGELLGFTTRDVQVAIMDCTAPPPDADTIPTNLGGVYYNSDSETVYACPGQELHFTLGATSMSYLNAVYADWNVSMLPGATYDKEGDGTHRASGTLHWTPGKSDVGSRVLVLRFKDSTCNVGQPVITETFYSIKITVLPYVDAGVDGIYCPPSGAAYKMKTNDVPGMHYKWTSISGSGTTPPFMDDDTLAHPGVKPAVNSVYMVTGSIYAPDKVTGPYRCTTHDTVKVNMGVPLITINAGPDQTICANTAITLLANITPSSAIGKFYWTSSDNLDDSTKLQPSATPSVSKEYTLYAEDVNGCGFEDVTKVIVDGIQPIIHPFASRDTVCPEGYSQLYANVSAQVCGIAQSSCTGGIATDRVIGTDAIPSTAPTPFNHTTNSGGERMQIMYRREELMAAGIKAGFINSLAFNLPAKNTTDSFYKFSIKMACTGDDRMSGSSLTSYPGTATVLPARTIGTSMGWNTFTFPNAYYWDGASNLIVEICWSKFYGTYGGTADPIYCSNTSYTSVHYVPSYVIPAPAMGDGCALNTSALLSSARPNIRFNVCVTPSLFNYAWSPSSFLTQPDSANTEIQGINTDMVYNLRVTSASNPTCFSTGSVSLTVDRSNSITALPLSPYIVCRPGYVTLDAEGHGPRPLRNIPCGLGTPVTCTSQTQITVANPAKGSLNGETTIQPFDGTYSTAHTQYIIPRSALTNGKMTSGSIYGLAIETVGASSMTFTNLKISLKCTDLDQFAATDPATFETGTVMVYNVASETIGGGGDHEFGFNAPYNWDTTKNLLVDICYAGATPGTGPTINAYSTPGFNLMCKAYQTSGDICLNPSTQIGPAIYESMPNFKVKFCSAGDTDFQYTWTPGEFMEDTTVKSPTLYVNNSTKVYVSTQGRSGCKVRDSVILVIPENHRYITPDTFICDNESINLKSYKGSFTVWYEGSDYHTPTTLSCDSCDVTIAKPHATTEYHGVVWDENGCIDTYKVVITVRPLPVVDLVNQDTTIKYGGSVTLRAFGGTQYYWYPLAGLTNPNSVNPVARPLVTTVYTVVGLGVNGCRNTDSVRVTIDYRNKLAVPSAFSPNNDGTNDVFRIANPTFQTLMEFRVFNRWGQEVFSTNDINGGWDGKWKGEPQDMGVYSYIIRVGYPDGYAETYKGDVTLVR